MLTVKTRFPNAVETGMDDILSPMAMPPRAPTLVSVALEMRQAKHILAGDALSSAVGRGPAKHLQLFRRFPECLGWDGTGVRIGGGIAALRLLADVPDQDSPSGLVQGIMRLPRPLS